MIIGAHIQRETTIIKTMDEIKKNGGNALQLFTTNPRSLKITNNDKYLNESHLIKKYCNINKFSLIVHSPYAFNIAKPFMIGKKQLDISDTLVFNDLITSNMIGAVGYVIHVGKSTTIPIPEALLMMKNNEIAIDYFISSIYLLFNFKQKKNTSHNLNNFTKLLSYL